MIDTSNKLNKKPRSDNNSLKALIKPTIGLPTKKKYLIHKQNFCCLPHLYRFLSFKQCISLQARRRVAPATNNHLSVETVNTLEDEVFCLKSFALDSRVVVSSDPLLVHCYFDLGLLP